MPRLALDAVLPKSLLALISINGHPYSVPVNIHRSNVMWYNPKVLQAAGVTIPSGGFASWTDFFAACDKIKAAVRPASRLDQKASLPCTCGRTS